MTEEEFLLAMQEMSSGNREALKDIYNAYLKVIYAVIFNQVKNKEAAEDITSEFFIKLYSIAGSFKGNGKHKAWLMTIAKNMCIDYMRKQSHETAVLDDDREETRTVKEPSVESHEENVVQKITIKEAMKALNENEKSIIDMKIVGGMTFKEIAEVMNMPMGTVTWHYNSGIKKLRREMS